MKKETIIYKDNLIYTEHEFLYDVYSDISDEALIDIFTKQKNIVDSQLSNENVSSKKWIASKIRLYGIYLSKPELFEVITPTGLNSPYSYYEIKLKSPIK